MNLKYVSGTQNKSDKPLCAAMLTQTNFTKNLLLSVVDYEFFLYYCKYSVCKLISSTTSKLNNCLQFDHKFATVIESVISGSTWYAILDKLVIHRIHNLLNYRPAILYCSHNNNVFWLLWCWYSLVLIASCNATHDTVFFFVNML